MKQLKSESQQKRSTKIINFTLSIIFLKILTNFLKVLGKSDDDKSISLLCLYKEHSCIKGMKLISWDSQAIWTKSINIDTLIPNRHSNRRSRVFPINSIICISVCKVKLIGVRLRDWLRSIKSWIGSRLFAPKVSPKGYPTPDNNLWLCRIYSNYKIC